MISFGGQAPHVLRAHMGHAVGPLERWNIPGMGWVGIVLGHVVAVM